MKSFFRFKPEPDLSKGARTIEELEYYWGNEKLVNHYLNQERLAFFKEVAMKLPAIGKTGRVIDVGCGTGHVLDEYAKLHNISSNRMVASDISCHALNWVNKLLPEVCLLRADILAINQVLRPVFNLVIATEVIEHLENPRKYILALTELLGSKGRLAITIPDGTIDHWIGHTNFWTLEEFVNFLKPIKELKVEIADRLSGGDLFFIAQKISSK